MSKLFSLFFENKEIIVKSFTRAVTLTLCALLVALWNPFGLRNSADILSRDILLRASAGFFRLQQPNPTAVILLDDASLQQAASGFPPDRAYLARLLERLAQLGARAIFVDLLLVDERPHDRILAETLKSLKENFSLPVLLASSVSEGRHGSCNDNVRDQFTAAAWQMVPVYEAVPENGRYPLLFKPCRTEAETAVDTSPLRPSAALSFYRLFCRDTAGCQYPPSQEEAAEFQDKLVLRWGDAPAKSLRDHRAEFVTCAARPESFVAALQFFIGSLVADVFSSIDPRDSNEKQKCFYQPSFYGWEVMSEKSSLDKILNTEINDRFVFIGYSLMGINDIAQSPVHGMIPAVFFHAMAFENLVTYGKHYMRAWPDIIWSFGVDSLIEIVFIFIISFLKEIQSAFNKITPFKYFPIIFMMLFIIFICVTTFYMRLEPVNWIGLTALVLIVSERHLEEALDWARLGLIARLKAPWRKE